MMCYYYATACDACQYAKGENQKARGLLKPIPTSSETWNDIAMDFLINLQIEEGLMSLLVAVDYCIKIMQILLFKKGIIT